jgi:putative inorganic carbon (hco3(-)) transporter
VTNEALGVTTRPRRRVPGANQGYTIARVGSLSLGSLWEFFWAQPPSFWGISAYLFLEYVRPQQIYDALARLPLSQIALGVTAACVLLEGVRLKLTFADGFILLFTVAVLLSSATAMSPDTSWAALPDYLTWVVIYLLIVNVVNTPPKFLFFMLCFLLYNFKMSQHGTRSWAQDGFVFRDWGTTGAPGFFENSGEFGIEMCVFIPLIVAFISSLRGYWSAWKRWIFWGIAATAVTGIVASSSRGALVGLAAVVLWMALRSRYKVRSMVIVVVLAALVWAILPPEQVGRLQTIGEDNTSTNRTLYWARGLQMLANNPILGIGYANWAPVYEASYGRRTLPHNIFVQAGAELGYVGLIAFVLLIGASFWVNRRTRQSADRRGLEPFYRLMSLGLDGALVGFLVSGQFVTVLYYPYFWINFAFSVALYRVTILTESASKPTRAPIRVLPGRAAS